MDKLMPTNTLSIYQTIAAIFVILCIFLLIIFWPQKKLDIPNQERSSDTDAAAIDTTSTSVVSSFEFAPSQTGSLSPIINPQIKNNFKDEATGFSFWYGVNMIITSPKSFYTEKGYVGYQINDPQNYGEIWVELQPDTSEKSYGPVSIEEVYSPPGGNLSKNYILFTGKYRVSVFAHYDVFPLYEEQLMKKKGISLTELVTEDLGEVLEKPITRLIERHPEEPSLSAFYKNVDKVVESMTDR